MTTPHNCDNFSVAVVSSGFIVPMKMKFAGKSIVWLPIVALFSSSTCKSAFCSFSLHLLSSSKNNIPWFALNIFPGVNACSDVGPCSSACVGSMSPSMSSTVKSGLPCILMNLSVPMIVFVLTVFVIMHFGHNGFLGSQLNPQSFTVIGGNSFARFFASVVLPTPGGPRIIECRFVMSVVLNCCFAVSCPRMSANGSCFVRISCCNSNCVMCVGIVLCL